MSNPFGELIASGEGNYNSYNRGTVRGRNGKERIVPANQEIDFSQMTIGELQQYQILPPGNPDRVFAVGKYQFIPRTLHEGVKKLRVVPSEKFTAELQEKLFNEYLLRRACRQIFAYISSAPGATLHDAQKAASKEWASVEDPDTPGHVFAQYEKHGNKMHTTAAQVAAALNEMRDEYKAQLDKGLSAQEAWLATAAMGPGQFQHIAKAPVAGHRAAGNVLVEGARSPAVGELQTYLHNLGYADSHGRPLTADNDFGQDTRRAVEAFQRDHGLSVDGVVGSNTWPVLRDASRAASIAESSITFPQMAAPDLDAVAIDALQQQLQTLGMTNHRGQPLPVTGTYDEPTRIAVTMFQKEQGLPGTGVADPATRALIEARATIAELQHIERGRSTSLRHAPLLEDVQVPAITQGIEPSLSSPVGKLPQPTATTDAAVYPNDVAHPQRTSQQTTSEPGLDDPRNARNPDHALYAMLKGRIPDACEERLVQFTAACHMKRITADKLEGIYLDETANSITFAAKLPLGVMATVDLKQPLPTPEQATQQVQHYDMQRTQQAQLDAQMAQQQNGPSMSGAGGHGRR